MFQPRHHRTALALAFSLLLIGCGGASSSPDGFVEEFDAGGNTSVGPDALVITTTTVPAGQPGVTYPVTKLDAAGANDLTWRITDGTLPPGIWLTTDGRLVGTPGAPGLYEFTAEATDGTHAAEQDLAIAVDTFALRTLRGLVHGDAWSGRGVVLGCAGHAGSVTFSVVANRSGGSLHDIDPTAGTAVWIPGPQAGTDILAARDSSSGETDELELEVFTDPTAPHEARFGDHDVWVLDWHAKRGAHPFATDLRAALQQLGLRSATGYGAGESEADRLAELCVQLEILRHINPLFGRTPDGEVTEDALAISFAFERPGAGYVAPAGGTFIAGRPNAYSVMALCNQSGAMAAMGVAFADVVGNANHEHNAPGGAYGELGVFVNFVSESVGNIFRLHGSTLVDAPVHDGDVDALKAILYRLPSPGGRYAVLRYQIQALAKCVAYITAHEIGHSLGLEHTSTYVPGAIMNSTAILGPNIDYHFTSADRLVLRAGLPGPGRGSLQALKVGAGVAATAAMAPGGLHVCGTCPR